MDGSDLELDESFEAIFRDMRNFAMRPAFASRFPDLAGYVYMDDNSPLGVDIFCLTQAPYRSVDLPTSPTSGKNAGSQRKQEPRTKIGRNMTSLTRSLCPTSMPQSVELEFPSTKPVSSGTSLDDLRPSSPPLGKRNALVVGECTTNQDSRQRETFSSFPRLHRELPPLFKYTLNNTSYAEKTGTTVRSSSCTHNLVARPLSQQPRQDQTQKSDACLQNHQDYIDNDVFLYPFSGRPMATDDSWLREFNFDMDSTVFDEKFEDFGELIYNE